MHILFSLSKFKRITLLVAMSVPTFTKPIYQIHTYFMSFSPLHGHQNVMATLLDLTVSHFILLSTSNWNRIIFAAFTCFLDVDDCSICVARQANTVRGCMLFLLFVHVSLKKKAKVTSRCSKA